MAQALAERDNDLKDYDMDATPDDKRLNLMDRLMVDTFQVSLVEHVQLAYGDEAWGRIRAKCDLDSSSATPPTDAFSCR